MLRGAHVEALGAPNGIGLVKLMGRDAGFIAAGAALANQEANFVLVPEIPFPLEGENGFLRALERRILSRGHALVVVAEGAGQHLFAREKVERDASGNVRYEDIGVFLRDRIERHFAERGIEINLKYIDPSYSIRSVPANAWDRTLTDHMSRNAVHAAMAGQDGRDDGMVEPGHRPRTHLDRRRREEADAPRQRSVERRAGHHRPAQLAARGLGEGDRAGPRRYSIISRVPAKVRSTFAKV